MTLVRVAAVPVLSMIVWTAVVGYGVLAGWWHPAIAPAGDTAAFMAAARQMMSSEPHGDLAIALLAKGQVADEHYIGLVDAVDRETVFPVASMSKWVTAVGVMQLVHEGKIDLDAPVARYLTRWTLPVEPVRSQRRHGAPPAEPHGWTHGWARLRRLPSRRARALTRRVPPGAEGINRQTGGDRCRL